MFFAIPAQTGPGGVPLDRQAAFPPLLIAAVLPLCCAFFPGRFLRLSPHVPKTYAPSTGFSTLFSTICG